LYTFLYLPLFLIANPWLTFFAVCCGAVQIYLLPILPNRSFDTNLMRVIGPVACVLAYRGSLLAKSAGPLGMRVVERYGPNIRAAVFAGLVLAAAAFMSRAVSVEKNLWWCLVGVLL